MLTHTLKKWAGLTREWIELPGGELLRLSAVVRIKYDARFGILSLKLSDGSDVCLEESKELEAAAIAEVLHDLGISQMPGGAQ